MNSYALMVFDSGSRSRPDFQKGVKTIRGHCDLFMTDHMTAGNRRTFLPAQVERDSLAPHPNFDRFVMDLDAADAKELVSRQTANAVARMDLSFQSRSGHDKTVALKRKHPVHRQPEVPGRRPGLFTFLEHLRDAMAKLIQSISGHERERNDRRIFQGSSRRQNIDVFFDLTDSCLAGKVGFGDHKNGALNTQKMKDVQMLFRLWHYAVIGRNRKKGEIDAVRAGEHVPDKSFVTGHIDNAGCSSIGKIQMRESKIDGNASFLFLFEPVRILAGQSLYETRLAVIDVSGGADDIRHAL
jgi:hypothetical protein